MLWLSLVAIVCAVITACFMIAEIHWSLQNVLRLMEGRNVFGKLIRIPFLPFCFLPLIWDVLITIGLTMLFGMGANLIGMMSSMVLCSLVAAYLFVQR